MRKTAKEVLMKKLVLLICLAVMALQALNAEELPIRNADDLRLEPYSFNTADGSQIVFWSDLSSGDRDIYCQKIGQEAQILFPEAIPLVTASGDQELLSVKPTSDNNFILLWAEKDIDVVTAIGVQKVSSNGMNLWGNGVEVSNLPIDHLTIELVANEIGGAFVIFQTALNQQILGQNLDSFGNRLWPIEGSVLLANEVPITLRGAVVGDAGGMILNVGHWINSAWQTRLLAYSASGSPQGDEALIPPNTFPGSSFSILPPVGGQYMLFKVPPQNGRVVYLNKMEASGNLLLAESFAYELSGEAYASFRGIANTPDGGVAIWWLAGDSVPNQQLKVQRFSSSLTEVWSQPVAVYSSDMDILSVQLYPVANGKLLISWSGRYDDPFYRAQLLDSDGSPVWAEGGKLITSNAAGFISLGGSEQSIFLWNTTESGYKKINIQAVGLNGEYGYPTGGFTLTQRLNYNCEMLNTFSLGERFLSLWIDHREGSNLFFQLLNQNMTPILETDGRKICPENSDYISLEASTITPDAKLAIIYSIHYYNDTEMEQATYLQIIDSAGATEFSGMGMELESNANYALSSVDDAIYIGWSKGLYSTPARLSAQKLVNGQAMWGDGGKLIHSVPLNSLLSISALVGNYIIWQQSDPGIDAVNIKVLMIDANGDPAAGWDASGMNLITSAGISLEEFQEGSIVGNDLVAFISVHSSGESGISVQRLSPSGERLWQAGGQVIGGNSTWMYRNSVVYDEEISLLSSNANDAVVLRRINALGVEVTPPEGLVVIPNINNCYDAVLKKYADGSMLCAYSDNDGAWIQNRDVFIRQISPEGVPMGDASSVLSGARYKQHNTRVAVIGNRALLTWADDRAGILNSEEAYTGIWGNIVISQFSSLHDPQLNPLVQPTINRNYPNPFNPETNISFSLPIAAVVALEVYNLKGQLVKRLLSDVPLEAGTHVRVWDGTDDRAKPVSSGIYFCRLATGSTRSVRKMLLAK
jgi:hypothetical protein